jgi:hypothetical protein
MRWPVNPQSFTVLSVDASVQAGGHMGTALDHADIYGISTPHLGRTGACLKLGARLHVSHNVIEDLSGMWRPPACMTDYRAGPRLSVIRPQMNPVSSRAIRFCVG